MFSFSKANHFVSNGKVIDSSIVSSSIDMTGGVITGHEMPSNPKEVANKEYVDLRVNVLEYTITLVGITPVLIDNSILTGQYNISIKNIVFGGPCATFTLTKNESNTEPFYSRNSISPGLSVTSEKLEVEWEPNTGIKVYKTDINLDGEYLVRLREL